MNSRTLYWYARGYFDGRSVGITDEDLTDYADADRQAYKDGYDRGVTDYCELDEPYPTEQNDA